MHGRGLFVVIASKSDLKQVAIRSAFEESEQAFANQFHLTNDICMLNNSENFTGFEFLADSFASDVNEQPIGWAEIIQGASNRSLV